VNKTYFPFCTESKKKKLKRDWFLLILISVAIIITTFFVEKAIILLGVSLSQLYICWRNKKACQKYYLAIDGKNLRFHTPDFEQQQIPLKNIQEIEINNKYLRLLLHNNEIITLYITDFDKEVIEKMKEYFENFIAN